MDDDSLIEKAREKISNFITLMALQGIGESEDYNFNAKQKEKFKSNYWGYIFSRIQRVPNLTLDVIMALVINHDGSVSLHYNPEMVLSMSDSDLLYTIEHEGLHLLNKHIPRMMRILNIEADKKKKRMKMGLFGIASDCVVNEQGNLPESLMVNGKHYDLCFPENYDLPSKKLTEFYYNELLKRELEKENEQKQQQESSSSDGETSVEAETEQTGDGSDDEPDGDSSESPSIDSGEDSDGKDSTRTPDTDAGSSENSEDISGESEKEGTGENKQGENNGYSSNALGQEQEEKDEITSPQLPDNNIDSHKGWETREDSTNPELLPKKIDDYIRNLISESTKMFESKKGIGNLPGHMIDMINDILKPPTVPYYQVIKQLVRGSRISKFKNSSTKINRKRSYVFFDEDGEFQLPSISPFPGKVRDFTFDIVILIDTSGSMSIKELKEGLSGIKDMIENDKHCKVTVIENDTQIHKEYQVKRIQDIDFNIKGRGGTRLLPGLMRARELECDICLVFTDGYIENINPVSRTILPKKIIWAVPEDGSVSAFNKVGLIVRTLKSRKKND